LKAIISINGCIHIDSHLASILYKSLNLFCSVPESQSEQALAYFEKHLNGLPFPLPAVRGKLNCILNNFNLLLLLQYFFLTTIIIIIKFGLQSWLIVGRV